MSKSMTDLPPSLPVELFHQIIGHADDDTLTNLARTSKQFSKQVAYECLYKNLQSPWPLIQLVLEPVKREATSAEGYATPNPSGGFTMELPITDDGIARFCNIAKLVRHLSYIEDAGKMCPECCAIASECIYRLIGLKHSENPQDLLIRLQSLQASCTSSYGVWGFTPWLSSSLVTLDLAFGPEVNDVAVISSLLHVRGLCKSVKSFTFTLDSSGYSHARDGVIDALCAVILAMPKLRMVTLPSELVTRPVVNALAHLKCLDTLACTPAMLPVAGDRAFTYSILSTTTSRSNESNVSSLDLHAPEIPPVSTTHHSTPSIMTSYFYALHNARTSSARSQREVASTVAMYNSTLVSFSAQQSPDERVAALEDVLAGS